MIKVLLKSFIYDQCITIFFTNVINNFIKPNIPKNGFAVIALPLIHRVFPALFATKIVGVSSIDEPVGLSYARRFKYDVETGYIENWK